MTSSHEFSVWVGCLACYNAGHLVGAWVPALVADRHEPCGRVDHEEYWCFDVELPLRREVSPMEATAVAETLLELPAGLTTSEWMEVADDLGVDRVELPTVAEDLGSVWDSFGEFVDEVIGEMPRETLLQYFDVAAFERDCDASGGLMRLASGRVIVR